MPDRFRRFRSVSAQFPVAPAFPCKSHNLANRDEAVMFHPHTERLIREWRERRIGGQLPARAEMSPVAFGPLLPQLFILGRERAGAEVFRLAGGLVNDLHGRELKGVNFLQLWAAGEREKIELTLGQARLLRSPLVITAEAIAASGQSISVEITLAPMVGPTGLADRIMGLYQPTSLTARLAGEPVAQLRLVDLAIVGPAERPSAMPHPAQRRGAHLRLAAVNGRIVA
jgi:hypothetical protein